MSDSNRKEKDATVCLIKMLLNSQMIFLWATLTLMSPLISAERLRTCHRPQRMKTRLRSMSCLSWGEIPPSGWQVGAQIFVIGARTSLHSWIVLQSSHLKILVKTTFLMVRLPVLLHHHLHRMLKWSVVAKRQPKNNLQVKNSQTTLHALSAGPHYTLEDTADTSDEKNSQIAHKFIRGLQDSRGSQKDVLETFSPAFNQDHGSTSENKIVFTKPKIKDQSGSNLIMLRRKKLNFNTWMTDKRQMKERMVLFITASAHVRIKRKKESGGTEKEEEDKKVSSVVFNSKKVNRNFRKTLEGGTEWALST